MKEYSMLSPKLKRRNSTLFNQYTEQQGTRPIVCKFDSSRKWDSRHPYCWLWVRETLLLLSMLRDTAVIPYCWLWVRETLLLLSMLMDRAVIPYCWLWVRETLLLLSMLMDRAVIPYCWLWVRETILLLSMTRERAVTVTVTVEWRKTGVRHPIAMGETGSGGSHSNDWRWISCSAIFTVNF